MRKVTKSLKINLNRFCPPEKCGLNNEINLFHTVPTFHAGLRKFIVSAADSCILIPFPCMLQPDDIPTRPHPKFSAYLVARFYNSNIFNPPKCYHKTRKLLWIWKHANLIATNGHSTRNIYSFTLYCLGLYLCIQCV